MNALDLKTINIYAPYSVWEEDDTFFFKTDFGINYSVDFDVDDNPLFTAYWFNLTNMSQEKSPGDIKIQKTIICIIEEFFRKNPDILLYMCSTEDNHQAQRARLFLRWFNRAEQQLKYLIIATEVKGEMIDGKRRTEYIALIVPRSHPQLEEIVNRFNEEVKMFNEYKP